MDCRVQRRQQAVLTHRVESHAALFDLVFAFPAGHRHAGMQDRLAVQNIAESTTDRRFAQRDSGQRTQRCLRRTIPAATVEIVPIVGGAHTIGRWHI